MRKALWLTVGGAVLLAAAAGSLWRDGKLPGMKKEEKKPSATLEFTPAELVRPTLTTLDATVQFSGALVAPDTAVVRAKAVGTLLALTVSEGDRVRSGQLLGRIDAAEGTARVAEREAQLAQARAQHEQAQRNLASNQRLADQQFISPQALDAARSAEATARAQVQAAQAAVQTQRLGLRESQVLAPVAGIVAKRQALPGEKVTMEQPLLTIVNLARLEMAGTVATHEVSRLRVGMPVQVMVEGDSQSVQARIARIAPAAEPGTRAIGVAVELANAQERWRAGQYAQASVRLAGDQPQLTLPLTAVTLQGGEAQVWLLEGGVLSRRVVVLGLRDESQGRVEVLKGLQPQSQVLAARFDNLRDGAAARVVARVQPSASAAGAGAVPAPAPSASR